MSGLILTISNPCGLGLVIIFVLVFWALCKKGDGSG
jgi:hypothetical protein